MPIARITTRRLILRLAARNDVPALSRLMNDPAIALGHGEVRYPSTPISVLRLLEGNPTNPGCVTLRYVIVLASNPRIIIGSTNISIIPNWLHPFIGYWIAKPFRGRGFATEAARALTETIYRESTVDVVAANCVVTNAASRRTLERAGMRRSIRRNTVKLAQVNRFVPSFFYSVTRKDWDHKQGPKRAVMR
jgi:RimJ/RimL family protein N-acetyltransferase